MPKSDRTVEQSIREFKGLRAGVGYAEVGISVTVGPNPAMSKIARAKSAQLVSGAPAN